MVWALTAYAGGGALSEGGIAYRPEIHDIVVALARRGIASSICARNDYAAARAVLEAHAIWDYSVAPPIVQITVCVL